jgi:predicted alpha/beta superfamily hydrolase
MKTLLAIFFSLLSLISFGQKLTTIKLYVPNKTDEVFIVGNQEVLGNWQPNQVKMEKISDYERSITLELDFPAEFKFTKGSWGNEGIVKSLLDNPNLRIEDLNANSSFKVKTWMDNIQADKLGLDYDIKYINSTLFGDKRMLNIYVPENYSPNRKYPVIYLTDGSGTNFPAVKGYVTAFSQPNFKLVPPSIVVGVVHKSRNEELYNEGNGKHFTEYLLNEVMPYIDSTYNTSGFNALVGHSNGAEFNHTLLVREDNPFRGFICLSTSFFGTGDIKEDLPSFIKNYTGKKMYYFIANATYDSPDRYQAGLTFDSLYQHNPNPKIDFKSQTYKANHQTIVPLGLYDGLQFIFRDYSDLDVYPTIYDYAQNYKVNVKENYGVEGQITRDDLEGYMLNIMHTKSKKDYEFALKFMNDNRLFNGGTLDPVNTAMGYFMVESYDETIKHFNQALEVIETINPDLFYGNALFGATRAYIAEGKIAEGIIFLEKAREKLPEYYSLGITYHIAKLSLENKVEIQNGKEALEYCKKNFRENKDFSMDDLIALEKQ